MNTEQANHIADTLAQHQSTQLNNQLEQHRERLNRLVAENANYQRVITANMGNMRRIGQTIDLMTQQGSQDHYASHLVEQWRELCEHPRLADAAIRGEVLTLETVDDIRLHAPDRSDSRWLGAFRITIGLSNGSITLHNLNTRRGGRDHPHVVEGNPCFGSNHAAFAQLQANGDLFTLFELLLQYLETINLEDEYGRFGSYWFDQEDAQPERETVWRNPAITEEVPF